MLVLIPQKNECSLKKIDVQYTNISDAKIFAKELKMEELVKLVSEKTGLNQEMSEMAVNLVLDYVKKKLPKPVAAQVDAVLGAGDALDAIGGLFGGKK
jgi:hypothetical protein